jgi:hypothetical protein
VEIDITDFFKTAETWNLSGSIATHGSNVARDTWNNAKQEARESPLLKTPDELDAMRKWAKSTGAWSKTEISAWSDEELNALFIQLVTGDMREAEFEDTDFEDIDWEAYEAKAQEGKISGAIFKGIDDRVYYSFD